MSDNIPFEIQSEIMKRLPVKSLIQFRSVSKPWRSLIDSPDFTARYRCQLQHLLVSYKDSDTFERKYVSIVDDHTFPNQKVSQFIPQLVTMLKHSITIGSDHGLLCLFGNHRDDCDGRIGRAIIWNPSVRKAVAVDVPNVPNRGDRMMYGTVLGFGVCCETMDPKIVKSRYIGSWRDIARISCIPLQVEVFTLSTGGWRKPSSVNLLRKSIRLDWLQVVVNGFIYWLATDRITVDGQCLNYNLIISFDLITEEFREVNLPDSLADKKSIYSSCMFMSLSTLRDSLVVLECGVEDNYPVFYVWMMQDGVSKSFRKLFTVDVKIPNVSVVSVRGFRKTGEPIVEDHVTRALAVYEPYSKHINSLGIIGLFNSFSVSSYAESLLLLDPQDFIVYANGKRYIQI